LLGRVSDSVREKKIKIVCDFAAKLCGGKGDFVVICVGLRNFVTNQIFGIRDY
jgi:hypothetical protein